MNGVIHLMRPRFVVAEADVEGVRTEGGTVFVKRTWDRSNPSTVLEQRVVRFAPGRSLPRRDAERDEILYVASVGTLAVDGAVHVVEPDTGANVRACETWAVEKPGPAELLVVSVSVLAQPSNGERRVTVRFADQPELRRMRGAPSVTSLTKGELPRSDAVVGVVEPCRAPDRPRVQRRRAPLHGERGHERGNFSIFKLGTDGTKTLVG